MQLTQTVEFSPKKNSQHPQLIRILQPPVPNTSKCSTLIKTKTNKTDAETNTNSCSPKAGYSRKSSSKQNNIEPSAIIAGKTRQKIEKLTPKRNPRCFPKKTQLQTTIEAN